jgi:hypothetical protein
MKAISRRAMRLSVRHLSGLIYDAVDDFVRGPNVTGPMSATIPPDAKCASTEAPSPDRFWVNISRQVRKRALTLDDLHRRRNLPNAASMDSTGDPFHRRWWLGVSLLICNCAVPCSFARAEARTQLLGPPGSLARDEELANAILLPVMP